MSEHVQHIFDRIAPRYDLVNSVLSLGMMPRWRRLAVRLSGAVPGQSVLDCAAGTGAQAIAFARCVGPAGRVVALDFSAEMLAQLPVRAWRAGVGNIETVQADMQALLFANHSFDCASCTFGIRNVDNPQLALAEMARVVRPGGKVVVVETGLPRNPLWRGIYGLYSGVFYPILGGALTGQWAAYRHLRDSIRSFPYGPEFANMLRAGHPFRKVELYPLLGGVVWIYVGEV